MHWEQHKEEFLRWTHDHGGQIRDQKKMPRTWQYLFRVWLDHIRQGPFGVLPGYHGPGFGCLTCDVPILYSSRKDWRMHVLTQNHKTAVVKRRCEKGEERMEKMELAVEGLRTDVRAALEAAQRPSPDIATLTRILKNLQRTSNGGTRFI
jgi:hypothetical protein